MSRGSEAGRQETGSEPGSAAGPYLRALSAGLRGAALPYGFSIVIWGSGQALIAGRGTPDVGQMVLFAGAAVAAYGLLKWIARERESAVDPQIGSPHLFRAGVVHVAAMVCAIGSVILLSRIHSGIAWPLGGFSATVLYILVTSVELGLLEAEAESSG